MPRSLASFALAAALAAPTPGRCAERVDEILAHARAAAGGDALAAVACSRARLHVETQGLSGTGERVEDHRGGRVVQRTDLGVIALADGFDGETPWSIEGNNPARPERGQDTRAGAVSAAYRRSFSYLTQRLPGRIEPLGERSEAARRFEVLRIAPDGGRPFELWLDAHTWLPDRSVEKSASDTLTTRYADWRRVDGVAVPFSLRESNGDAKYDTQSTVESIAFVAAADASEFALPAPPPRDFGIADDAPSTRVPFELVNNHLFATVKLAGHEAPLIVDTGGLNVVTPELARELGLAVSGAIEGRGVGAGKVDVGIARVARVELGAAFLENQTFYVMALGPMAGVEGRAVGGIVGYEVFRRFVARIDYDARTLTLSDPARFTPPGAGAELPIAFDDHTPRIEAEIDGLRGWFDVDTGSRSSLTLAGPFVDAHGLRARYAPRFTATTGWGVGGASRSQLARARALRIGPFTVNAPVTLLSVQKAGSFAASDIAGNIGGGILRRFDWTLDYEHQRLWLEPNAQFGQPDAFDRSGMWLNDTGSALEVVDVTPGGPAERAGLRVGERVRGIDGAPAHDDDLLKLRARFLADPPGTRIRLELEAPDGTRREATLVLEDLV